MLPFCLNQVIRWFRAAYKVSETENLGTEKIEKNYGTTKDDAAADVTVILIIFTKFK